MVKTLKRSRVLAPAVKQMMINTQKIHHVIRSTRTEDDNVDWDTPGGVGVHVGEGVCERCVWERVRV